MAEALLAKTLKLAPQLTARLDTGQRAFKAACDTYIDYVRSG